MLASILKIDYKDFNPQSGSTHFQVMVRKERHMANTVSEDADPNPTAAPLWAQIMRGIGAMVLGIYLLLFPVGTLLVLGQALAVYLVANGVIRVIGVFRGGGKENRVPGFVLGAITIVIGVVVLGAPLAGAVLAGLITIIMGVVFGLGILAAGIVAIVVALFRHSGHGRNTLLLQGVLGILLGVLTFAIVSTSDLPPTASVRMAGALATLDGAVMIWNGLHARRPSLPSALGAKT